MHLGHAFVEIHVFHTHVKVATICAEGVPLLATICAETTICDDLSRHKLSSIKRCRRRHLSSGDKMCRNRSTLCLFAKVRKNPRWLSRRGIVELAKKKVTPQDSYSIRCLPQIFGASLHAINHVETTI